MQKQKKSHIFLESVSDLLHKETHLAVVPLMAFICGILLYFGLPFEPNLWCLICLTIISGCVCFIPANRIFKIIFQRTTFFCLLGVLIVSVHAHFITTRFIPHTVLNVQVSGIITTVQPRINRSVITLEPTEIYFRDAQTHTRMPVFEKKEYPTRIRLTVYHTYRTLHPGDKITGTVFRLSQPAPALTPYSTGQNITAWFEGIGAIGTMRRFHVEKATSSTDSNLFFLNRLRTHIHTLFQRTFSAENAGIAEALVLGGTDYVTESARNLYRDLGLAHILSVSGFHIGLIMLLVYTAIRLFFCLLPDIFTTVFIKRTAVMAALITGCLYVVLSQAHAPAVRAYLMMLFIFTAIFFDKRALSVRTIFIVAVLMLCIAPHLILSAGFQLSFIAVLCMVGVWDSFQNKLKIKRKHSYLTHILQGIIAFVALNLLITITTLPFIAYHFHQIQLYGVIGNFLFGSLFAFIIIPLLFLSVLLMATPVAVPLLNLADKLLSFINQTGMPITDWTYAHITTPYFHTYGLIFWSIGLMGVALFETRIRRGFAILMLLIIPSFFGIEKPVALIGSGGNYIGLNQNGQFYATESYYYPQWHGAFLLYERQTPFSTLPHRLPDKNIAIDFFRLNQTNADCETATLTVRRKKTMHCPNQISMEDLYDLYGISVYKEKRGIRLFVAGYAHQNRPWRLHTPLLSITDKRIRITP